VSARDPRLDPAATDTLRTGSEIATVDRVVPTRLGRVVDFRAAGCGYSLPLRVWRDWMRGADVVTVAPNHRSA
jgi:hypothetical protein